MYTVGDKVIIRTNEKEPLIIGIIEEIGTRIGKLPAKVFVRTKQGRVMAAGAMAIYTVRRMRALNKLTYKEQYAVMTQFF